MFIELLKRYWFTLLVILVAIGLWAKNISLESELSDIRANEASALKKGVENSYDIFLESQQKQDEIGSKYAFNTQKYNYDVISDIAGINDGSIRVQFSTQYPDNETESTNTVPKDGYKCPKVPVTIPIPVQQDIRRLQNSIENDREVIEYLQEKVKLLEGIIDKHNLN